ncbi:unnamed protein product [marine sediment metagenome]|uniref:Uncharacterized protein n=1 Tax=marine sediment metagenome TaxID=412755 RepID=X0V2E9_9ZZZZ
MFKKLVILFVITGLLLLPVQSYATDSYNNSVSVRESKDGVALHGVQAFTAGATDSHYTQAMYIGDLNLYNIFCAAWTNSTASDDVNLNVEYSYDRETWVAATINSGALFDDLNGGTVQADTLNIYEGTADGLYHAMIWLRLVFDGQSGNTTPVTVTWTVHGTKNQQGKMVSKGNRVRNRIT